MPKFPMAGLNECEEVCLLRMYNLRIIGMAYLPKWKIQAKIEWRELIETYGYQFADFDRVMDKFFRYRLAFDHGKSKQVASLSPSGVAYAVHLLKLRKYPKESPSP